MSSEQEKATQASEEMPAQPKNPSQRAEQSTPGEEQQPETPVAGQGAPLAREVTPQAPGSPSASGEASAKAASAGEYEADHDDWSQFTYQEHASPSPASGLAGFGWSPPAALPPLPSPPAMTPLAPGQWPGSLPTPYGGMSAYPFPSQSFPYPGYGGEPRWPGYWYPGPPLYQGYPAWPYWPGSPGSSGYSVPWYPGYAAVPPRPRDHSQVVLGIFGMICSLLCLLFGLGVLFLSSIAIWLFSFHASRPSVYYPAEVQFLTYTFAGLIGGSFCLYHSIRALLGKPSRVLKLPAFWIFLVCYLVTLGLGLVLQAAHQAVSFLPATTILIILTAILPALTLLTLGMRLLRRARWSTSWRRFTLALTSGATMGILLASLLELVATMLLEAGSGLTLSCFDNPSILACQGKFNLIAIILAVVTAPLIEESVKPLGVALLSGRVASGIEAFILGMSAGLGFDLIETIGYISMGYSDWAHVALVRSGAGLLHGLGGGMVALGWYHLIRTRKRRFRLGFACWMYAVLQHALWNACGSLELWPAPVGPMVEGWQLNLGFTSFSFDELLIIFLTIIGVVLFLLIVRWLRDHYQEETTPEPAGPTVSSSGRPVAIGV
ncbi:MAG: PrsW family intramembrane metalloprotease [Thermogemmatispora sp.]|uniref:PrsW family glutamic-type intramembrane protease n=2 Tax=Thermogemmatispora sp. TaxID=1968838 RepID=UPI001D9C84C7|nr:PrsW family glutamic-type intramembrane protease [Thermogemmatispora sp.]MBX5450711.1 PrsW family intramembrane metalloprotease [Thermogemmatispora sp.]